VSGAAPGYVSTRDPQGPPCDFEEALRRGLAPDGGLYVPAWLPPLPARWSEADDWPSVAGAALRPWFAEHAAEAWLAAVPEALDFPVPISSLAGRRGLLELHHGPTLAFKDVGARTMARWLAHSLTSRGERATVLVATSGDTGSAVADGFAGMPGLRVVVLYPAGRVSPVQERQLTAPRAGVDALAVAGDFDACQRLVKGALVDPALVGLGLTSANSINLGRLLPQTSYHVWGALQFARALGVSTRDVLVVVPSGNLGNLLAGLLAAAMGLPLAGLVAAHNANDHFPRVLLGAADPAAAPATIATLSNAMDVGAPGNLERILALFPQRRYPVPLYGVSVDDRATLAALARTWHEDGALVCPHTAVGLEALRHLRAREPALARTPALVLATAHPAKFPEVVERALPDVRATHPRLAALPPARPSASLAPEPAALRAWLRERFG
jgi:threonine synthase